MSDPRLKILVTGGSGFIGASLCKVLAEKGHAVLATVRNERTGLSLRNTVERVIIPDIGPDTDWDIALRGVSVVVHLAARAHILRETNADPLSEYRRVNALGTERLAKAAVFASVSRFVYLSSIGVNGECTEGNPFTENDIPRPVRPYAVAKWEGEQALTAAARSTGMEPIILRPPLVYGPGARGNMLTLMDLVHRGIPLPVGGIRNRRSYIGLRNLIDALVMTIESRKRGGQLFLLSEGKDLSTPGLVTLVAEAMGKHPCIYSVPEWSFRAVERIHPAIREKFTQITGSLQIDSGRFRRESGWSPVETVENGITAMVREYLLKKENTSSSYVEKNI